MSAERVWSLVLAQPRALSALPEFEGPFQAGHGSEVLAFPEEAHAHVVPDRRRGRVSDGHNRQGHGRGG